MSEFILPDYEESWVLALGYLCEKLAKPFYRGLAMKGNLSERKARTAFDRLVSMMCLERIRKFGKTRGAWTKQYRLTALGRIRLWNLMRYYYGLGVQVKGQETMDKTIEERLAQWGFRIPIPHGFIPFIHQRLDPDSALNYRLKSNP